MGYPGAADFNTGACLRPPIRKKASARGAGSLSFALHLWAASYWSLRPFSLLSLSAAASRRFAPRCPRDGGRTPQTIGPGLFLGQVA